jgi:hypothetical protein
MKVLCTQDPIRVQHRFYTAACYPLRRAHVVADAHAQLIRARQASLDLMAKSDADISSELLQQMVTFAEYERRALSRLNRAGQDLDCQRIIESVKPLEGRR